MEQHSGRPGEERIAPEAAGEPVEPFGLPVFPGTAEPGRRPAAEPGTGRVVDLRAAGRGEGLLPALPGQGDDPGEAFGARPAVRDAGAGGVLDTYRAPGALDVTTAGGPSGAPADTGAFGAALPAAPERPALPQRQPAADRSGLPQLPVRPAPEAQSGTPFDAFGASGGSSSPSAPAGGGSDRTTPGLGSFGSLGGNGSFDGFAAGSPAPRSDLRPLSDRAPGAEPGAGDTAAGPDAPGHGDVALFDSALPAPRTPRPPRDPLLAGDTPSGGSARVSRVATTEFLLTVNPIDGTEVVPSPPQERRTPARRTPQERAARMDGARPTPPPGPPTPELPLLERDEERERLIRLLARGRSVRVTGASGSGRSSLLDSVANACGDLAPDGVLRLSGYRRSTADVLQDLHTLVHTGEGYRPDRAELLTLLAGVGAVVVLDDLELGGSALEELLAAAPECAFLMSATPDVPAPAADSMVEEVFLSGLSRSACIDLLQLSAGRRLAEDETAWAADLWFESEGLPLRFVQAGALLRQRDALRMPVEPPDWDDSVWDNGAPGAAAPLGLQLPDLSGFDGPAAGPQDAAAAHRTAGSPAGAPPAAALPAAEVPLPSLAESAAPADLLASRLSEAAREALAFAVALDGECPHPSHLPALVGDTHGDAALGELTSVGLAVPVASHFRLAAGVVQQLAANLRADGELSEIQAHTAAVHYTWWTGHPSVTPERAAGESEAILSAMAACRDGGNASAAVLLARTVAPVFAAALHWGAWERALRIGQEAARLTGEVAEEAYFHHELGVLALCTGHLDRARAELEASIALRGALADRKGTVVGRRTLALVLDREGATGGVPFDLEIDGFGSAGAAVTMPLPPAAEPAAVLISAPKTPGGATAHRGVAARRLPLVGTRRNLIVAGSGALLVAALGTVVAIGTSGGKGGDTPNQVQPIESVQQDAPTDTTAPPEDGTTAPAAPAVSSTSPSSSPSTAPTTPAGGQPPTTPTGGITSPPAPPTSPAAGGGGPTPTHTSSHPTTPPTSTHTTTSTPTQTPSTPTQTPSTPTDPPSVGTAPQSSSTGPTP
ncbi:hypothetical protein SAMN05216267_1020112 [Actinacidiphila rubida]|uniref:Uncharacterized protein n=1 Tax=Actinacidiphila rubida TaxID=310780 RepID=A0A1H8MZL9_9ACTN|nr:ATP-binding protein [Actinacidiphila rubida]SEO22744.1 hypothetical protein SAMN05216267_1020112 [Actinacidiphila rubida]